MVYYILHKKRISVSSFIYTLIHLISFSGFLPNELKLSSKVLLSADDDGDVVFVGDDVDSGMWHFGLDIVATLHRNDLVLATVEYGDVTVHVVTDIIKI